MKSKLCLVLTENTLREDLKVLDAHKNIIDMAELRADFLSPEKLDSLQDFPSLTNIPVILTVRKPEDGGYYRGSETERNRILLKALKGGYFAVDIEENLAPCGIEEAAEKNGTRIIRSFHDFQGTPEDLEERIRTEARHPGEIVKAAVTPRNYSDLCRIYETGKKLAGREKILLGMGDLGFSTRVLADRLGSFLTYTSALPGKAAPGHTTPGALADMYRFKNLDEHTILTGIIGNPVMHTRSPGLHNRWFAESGINAVYIPFPVADCKDFINFAEKENIRGFSVTVPHKQEIMKYIDTDDAAVGIIGACNTVYREANGWKGTNTDAEGFIKPLLNKLGKNNLNGKKAAVVGAGGAARAVVFALKKQGADVLVLNRTAEKAKKLAEEFGCSHAPLSEDSREALKQYGEIIVQTTSAGMGDGRDPIPFYDFKGTEVLYDIIYTPPVTPVMERAGLSGCTVIGGYAMLEEQAKRQFELFRKASEGQGINRKNNKDTETEQTDSAE